MSVYTVTFTTKDSADNLLGCDALLDEFTTAEFGTGTLTDVDADSKALILSRDTSPSSAISTKVKFVFKTLIGSTNVSVAEFEVKDSVEGSDLCSGGTATSRSSIGAGYVASKAVDDDNATMWNEAFIADSSWWAYEFTSAVDLLEYTIRARSSYLNDSPTSWDIYIWDSDEDDWIFLGSESTSADWTASEIRTFDFPTVFGYKTSGNKISSAVSVGSYGTSAPGLKIKWDATIPADTTLTIETGISDSNSTPPPTWYEQTNGSSITNLPADLTGKYLYYKASLATTDNAVSPKLNWLVIYDGDDSPTAAARVDFNGEIKSVPSTGSVTFTSVEAGTDLPYTVYALALDWVDKFEKIHPDGSADTVTVADADVTETVNVVIPNALVTQQYIEAAVASETRNARVTQQYVEAAVLPEVWNAVVTQQYIEAAVVTENSAAQVTQQYIEAACLLITSSALPLYLGDQQVTAVYLGTTEITDVFLGRA